INSATGSCTRGDKVRHFIAYHNTEKMGRPLREGDPHGLATNKHVNHLLQNVVWFVVGEGSKKKSYSLGSVFKVAETGDLNDDRFKRFASGPGHTFEPTVPLNEKEWFGEVLRATGNFGLGVQEIKDETVIAELSKIAAEAGYAVD